MKKIDLEKTEDLLKLKEEINNVIEKRIYESKRTEAINSIDELPFGTVRMIFESVTDKLYNTVNGKKLIGRYLKAITENKDMSKLYMIYDYVNHPVNISDVNSFLSEAIDMAHNLDSKGIEKSSKKVNNIVKNCVKESNISTEELNDIVNKNRINESVRYLINTKKSLSNLHEYVDNLSNVSSYIMENMSTKNVNEEHKSIKELISDLNSAFCNDLNEWESKVVKDLAMANLSNSNKKNLFENYKSQCLETIDEYLSSEQNIENKSQISAMKLQLENKEYSEETLSEDLLNLAELKHTLSE